MTPTDRTSLGLLLAYYGDDFTGSTDALESLATSGIETVLFVDPPSEDMLHRYPHVRAIGVAGHSRAMSPSEMGRDLPNVFHALERHRPKFVHYKVCSTFDSSPEIGSIGRAIDIGHRIFQNGFVPLLVASPPLARYCVFGNLFARSGLASQVFRLDRHPTMQRHPITPMNESDLRVHLSRQTMRPIELVDVLALEHGDDAAFEQLRRTVPDNGSVVLFDALTETHLATIGRLICTAQEQERKTLFVVGSSGVEQALGRHWKPSCTMSAAPEVEPVDRVLVVSGSCSPVTGRQIGWALENGFAEISLDTAALCQSKPQDADAATIAKQVVSALDSGQSVIVHTSRGPSDPRVQATLRALGRDGASAQTLGTVLGRILRDVLRSRLVRRLAVVGGDTSGYVVRSLGVEALQFAGPLEPGAPLCRIHSRDKDIDGVEIVLKGGQVGYDEFFGAVLHGRPSRALMGGIR